jgi:ATP/maltotriose-dependent transcriptional regulator MalT
MIRPILETKLHMPTWRKGLIARRRLLERLNRVAEAKLTLVSAPAAGFGKTTLLAAWLASGQLRASWLSLDHGDNHATSFWTYVIAALRRRRQASGRRRWPSLTHRSRRLNPSVACCSTTSALFQTRSCSSSTTIT